MVKACKFFASGACKRGPACTYSHEATSFSKLRPEADTFIPQPQHTTTLPDTTAKTNSIPCRFHQLGRCKKGVDCPFQHSDENNSLLKEKQDAGLDRNTAPPKPVPAQNTKVETCPVADSERSTRGSEARHLRGALVMFGPGAQVCELEFPSDYSAVQMTSLQPHCDAEAFRKFAATLGETIGLSSMRIWQVTNPPSTAASVRVRDSGFAQRLKEKADLSMDGTRVSDITVSIAQVGIKSASSGNRLQMSTVCCTWYKPSRTAWLHYNSIGKAKAAERFITGRDFRIAGRKVEATLQIPEHRPLHQKSTVTSVRLGNLDASTAQSLIERHIPGHLTPTNVIMGKTSYSTSLHQAAECVKGLLGGVGPLEAWEPNYTASATQVKAIARFQAAEDARKAVVQLSGKQMPELANSKVFVSLLISVKFNVLKAMYRAIRDEVDHLKAQVWDTGHVHIKAYPPADPTQRLICLRLYGEDAKAVAKAKSALEKTLVGDVATNEDVGIWDDFFANPGGLVYLNELSRTHKGYIYRDMRKHRLSLYGSADSKRKMRSALTEKLDRLMETTHYISLSAEDLKKALQGGFRRIVGTLGKHKASLDIRQKPQIITIIGSTRDLETARALLNGDVASDSENLVLDEGTADRPDCAVCWTEAEDAYRTPCGHFYCRDCFVSQCSSASDGDVPVRCFGDSGECLQVLTIAEIKNTLPSEAFEQLLEDSFTTHVRTHPQSFQYCPTPDCQQIYRVSSTGVNFTCPACLTPVCTSCHVVSHDGMTCELYRRVQTEGDEEFRTWKRENEVKDCPECKVPIEKSAGCNHMRTSSTDFPESHSLNFFSKRNLYRA